MLCAEPPTRLLIGDRGEKEVATWRLVPDQVGTYRSSHGRGDIEHVHGTPAVDESVLDLGGEGISRPACRVDRDDVEMRDQGERRRFGIEAGDPIHQRLPAGDGLEYLPFDPDVLDEGAH